MKILNREVEKELELNKLSECLWCDRSLEIDSSVKNLVCRKCFELMITAGLKEKEIFREK